MWRSALTVVTVGAARCVQAAVALGVTALAIGYIGRLAGKAVQDYEAEAAEKRASE